jgi:hypothetical protein
LTSSGQPVRLKPEIGIEKSTFWIARDTLYTATKSGRKVGCPVVGEGEVTCKVLEQQPTTMTIRWVPGYTIQMLVDRDAVKAWLDDSYAIVGSLMEDKVININEIIAKILEETK